MTIVTATCPECGTVELLPSQMTILEDRVKGTKRFCFQCPDCQKGVGKDADIIVVDLLTTAGVKVFSGSVPAELKEAHPAGDRFHLDDLLEFHLILQTENWWKELVSPS